MSVQLLDKTRKINKLLHNNNTSKVVFNDICEVLSEILESNILVLSKKGKVLGFSVWKDVDVINELMENNIGSFADHMLNERLFPQKRMSIWLHLDSLRKTVINTRQL